jgi:hypothetical protein
MCWRWKRWIFGILVLDLGVGFHGVSVILTVVVAVEVLDLASLWCLMWCFCCSSDGLVVGISLFLEKHLRGGDGVAALWWLEVLTWRWVIGVEVVVVGLQILAAVVGGIGGGRAADLDPVVFVMVEMAR